MKCHYCNKAIVGEYLTIHEMDKENNTMHHYPVHESCIPAFAPKEDEPNKHKEGNNIANIAGAF